jgi:hypothetical protein
MRLTERQQNINYLKRSKKMAVTKQEVTQLYVATFNRAPDATGLNFWVNSGATIEEIAEIFFMMPETQNKYPEGTTDEEFINAIYQNVFGRDAEQEGLDYWVDVLGSGDSTRSQMILTVIEGAQGVDADVLANKTEVGLYYADVLGIDTPAGEPFLLDGVTDDEATVVAAKAAADELVDDPGPVDPPVVPGEEFWLTGARDVLTGTENNDVFIAWGDVNPWGQETNSLNSGDILDGGAGRDQLWADVFMGSSNLYTPQAIGFRSKNIEEMYFNALETFDDSGFGEIFLPAQFQNVSIKAGNLLDVDYIESYYSDVDLTVYGLTTNTSAGPNTRLSDMTVSMDHTSGITDYTGPIYGKSLRPTNGDFSYEDWYYEYYINGKLVPSSMKVLFEQNYLVPGTESESQAIYYLLDQDADLFNTDVDNDGVTDLLANINANGLQFTVDGVAQVIEFDPDLLLTDQILNHADFVAALQPALAQLIADGVVPADTTLTVDPGMIDNTFLDDGSISSDIPAIVLETKTEAILVSTGFKWVTDLVGEYNVYGRLASDADVSDQPLRINIELEKVGRGADGGGLIVGGDNYTKGFDVFDVTVKGDEDMPSSLAYLLTTPHDGLNTLNIKSEVRIDESYADLQIGNTNTPVYSVIDLNNMFATEFMGNLDINQAYVVSGGDYDYQFGGGNDNLELIIEDFVSFDDEGVTFDISMGAGNDNVEIELDTHALDTIGDYLKIETGSGNDSVTIDSELTYGGDDGGASQQTMFLLDNMDIFTGVGNDEVEIQGRARFNIEAGSGNDTVYIDNNGATGEWSFGQNTGPQVFGLAPYAGRVLYNADLTVSFAGFESKVSVVTTAANNYLATQMDINAAIIKAIEQDTVLNRLLTVDYESGLQQITVESLVDGYNELSVALFQPELVATGAVAGQINLPPTGSNLTALRQGIIDYSPATSADVLANADLIAYFNDGTNDNVGDGDLGLTGEETAGLRFFGADGDGSSNGNVLNFSEINMGSGVDDLVILGSNDLSANTLIIDDQFNNAANKISVVNFFATPVEDTDYFIDPVGTAVQNALPLYQGVGAYVGWHALDFTYYLNNLVDPSDNAPNQQSAVPIPVTLNYNAGGNIGDVLANSVNIIDFDSTGTTVTFGSFTATQLLDALNGGATPVGANYGGIVDGTLEAIDNVALVGTTANYILMVQNDTNLGEFKVFHLTANDPATAATGPTDGDFATSTLLGTIDFGYGFGVDDDFVPTASTEITFSDYDTGDFTEVNLIGSTLNAELTDLFLAGSSF